MKVDFKKIYNEKKIAVAVSGGIDSMALVLLTKKFVSDSGKKIEIIAITVDHGLRPSSTKEAKFVAESMKKHGIKHYILKWEGEKPEFNVEAIAREKRYELLTKFCKSHGIKYLLVAHHADDQAENFLIRLFRGSGIDGLASMKDVNEMNGVKILRPLLNVPKDELQNYLTKHNIDWIEDESNIDEKYLRNKIRKFLNSLDDKNAIVNRINSAVNSIARARDTIEAELLKEAKNIVEYCDEGYVKLDIDKFCKLDEELGLRLLAWCLMEISGNPYKPRLEKLKRIYSDIINEKLTKATTFYGCVLERKNKIIIYREKKAIKNELIAIGDSEFLWDGRFIIKLKKDLNLKDKMNKINVETLNSEELKKVLKNCKKSEKIKGIDKKILLTIPIIKVKNHKAEKIFIPHLNYGNEDLAKNIFISKKPVTKLFV